MLDRSESLSTTALPSLTKSSRHYLQSTSLEEFISLSKNNEKLVPGKLITIPTTPVKRRRHRNDPKHTKGSSRNTSSSGQLPLSINTGSSTRNIANTTLKSTVNASPIKLPGVKLALQMSRNLN
jgi:hypothetical protein